MTQRRVSNLLFDVESPSKFVLHDAPDFSVRFAGNLRHTWRIFDGDRASRENPLHFISRHDAAAALEQMVIAARNYARENQNGN
jgi:hypothetical protein